MALLNVLCPAVSSPHFTHLSFTAEKVFLGQILLPEPEWKEPAQKRRATGQGRPEVPFSLLSANSVGLEKCYETQKNAGCHL